MPRLHLHINPYRVGRVQQLMILNNVSITLENGTITGILGRNGCGKSTLMNIIFGKFKADTIAHYDGKPIRLSDNMKHQLVAYLPQHPFIIGPVTVVDAVQMWYPDPVDQDRILYEPLIHKVHRVKVGALSLGERKFLEFLLVIYTERPYILLDEPFSMLAPLQIERVKEIIERIKPHKGILMSDHYYENVIDMADSSFVLKDSKLIPVENSEDLKANFYLL